MGDGQLEYDLPEVPSEENLVDNGSGMGTGLEDSMTSVITKEILTSMAKNGSALISNFTTTTLAPMVPEEFAVNPWRVGFVALKAVLVLLLLTLVLASRRDFIKTFSLVLLLSFLAEVGFDVYLEINASIHKLIGVFQELSIYGHLWVHYSGYRAFTDLPWTSITLFLIENFVFWSLLISTIVLFYFSRKAITQPEDIKYTPTYWTFIQAQSIPFLLVALTALFIVSPLPQWLVLPISVLIRLFAVGLSLIVLVQFLTAFFYYCRRRDDYVIASPHSLIRYARSRLFWVQVFAFFAHIMTAPFVVWSGISLTEDVMSIFSYHPIEPSVLLFAHRLFTVHLHSLILRPLILPILCIAFLPILRKRFLKTFFPCCCRKQ